MQDVRLHLRIAEPADRRFSREDHIRRRRAEGYGHELHERRMGRAAILHAFERRPCLRFHTQWRRNMRGRRRLDRPISWPGGYVWPSGHSKALISPRSYASAKSKSSSVGSRIRSGSVGATCARAGGPLAAPRSSQTPVSVRATTKQLWPRKIAFISQESRRGDVGEHLIIGRRQGLSASRVRGRGRASKTSPSWSEKRANPQGSSTSFRLIA